MNIVKKRIDYSLIAQQTNLDLKTVRRAILSNEYSNQRTMEKIANFVNISVSDLFYSNISPEQVLLKKLDKEGAV